MLHFTKNCAHVVDAAASAQETTCSMFRDDYDKGIACCCTEAASSARD
jgi:hypothetical protein